MSPLRWSLALTLIACPWSETAHAGQPGAAELAAEAEAQREAGIADREGRAGGDPEGFTKCAATYLSLVGQGSGRDDELLWNAAQCAAEAGQLGQAMQCWRTIVDAHPSSRLAGPAMLHLADHASAIARYDEAAAAYERFATTFPREDPAADALHNAYLLRVGLGQGDAAIADLDDYQRLYAGRDPERAAALFWSRHDLLDGWKQQREHALDYLRVHGHAGGLDRVVVAEAAIAQIDWRTSCRSTMVLDACIAIERTPKRALHPNLAGALARTAPASESSDRLPKRCGDASQPVYKLLRRDKKLAARAQDRFARVLDLVAKAGAAIPADQVDRKNAFADAWGMALVYRNDLRLEQLIAFELPTKLDFTVERWRKGSGVHAWEQAYFEQVRTRDDSDKRLLTALAEQHRLVAELLANATEVRSSGSAEWTFVGLAHAAMGQQALSGHLRRAALPNTLRRKVQVDAYCERLAAQAEPIETELSKLLMYCVERATEYQYFDAAARWCEAELSLLDVARYPRTDELFGTSRYAPTGLRSFGVQADPDVLPESALTTQSYSAAEGSR